MGNRTPRFSKDYLQMMQRRATTASGGRHSEGKKPYFSGLDDYLEMEYYDLGDFDFDFPWMPPGGSGGPGPPSGSGGPNGGSGGPCAGRILWPPNIDLECDVLEYDLAGSVSGAVGSLTFQPGFNSVLNADGDELEISGGVLTLPNNPDGSETNIDFYYCDDCGCGYHILDLPDCSCTTPCDPLPTVTGADTIDPDATGQYTFNDSQGTVTWGISGSGFSIDQTGLVTTSSACGTGTVTATDSCCGEFTKEIRSTNGYWVLVSTAGSSTCINLSNCSIGCAWGPSGYHGGYLCEDVSGGSKIRYTGFKFCHQEDPLIPLSCGGVSKEAAPCTSSPIATCSVWPVDCGSYTPEWVLCKKETFSWNCIP